MTGPRKSIRSVRSWTRKAGISWQTSGPGPGVVDAFRRIPAGVDLDRVFGPTYSGRAWRDVFLIWIAFNDKPGAMYGLGMSATHALIHYGAQLPGAAWPFSFRWAWSYNAARVLFGLSLASWQWVQVFTGTYIRAGWKGLPINPCNSAGLDVREMLGLIPARDN